MRRPQRVKRLRAEIRAIQRRVAALPVLDARSADEILDYDYGDLFAYALATTSVEPLLFKGDDFSKTDVVNALDER